mgnify:CR=1 FL=1
MLHFKFRIILNISRLLRKLLGLELPSRQGWRSKKARTPAHSPAPAPLPATTKPVVHDDTASQPLAAAAAPSGGVSTATTISKHAEPPRRRRLAVVLSSDGSEDEDDGVPLLTLLRQRGGAHKPRGIGGGGRAEGDAAGVGKRGTPSMATAAGATATATATGTRTAATGTAKRKAERSTATAWRGVSSTRARGPRAVRKAAASGHSSRVKVESGDEGLSALCDAPGASDLGDSASDEEGIRTSDLGLDPDAVDGMVERMLSGHGSTAKQKWEEMVGELYVWTRCMVACSGGGGGFHRSIIAVMLCVLCLHWPPYQCGGCVSDSYEMYKCLLLQADNECVVATLS